MNKAERKWTIKSAEGTKFDFFPVFLFDEKEGQPKCTDVKIKIDDKTHTFNFLNLFTFIYFCANEELRQQLAQRYERKVNYLPYDVTFKLSSNERASGTVKRRIELPVGEIIMAIARNEAFKLKFLREKIKNKGRIINR